MSCEIKLEHAHSHLCDVHAKFILKRACNVFVCGTFLACYWRSLFSTLFVAKMATNSSKLLLLRLFKLIKVYLYTSRTNSLVKHGFVLREPHESTNSATSNFFPNETLTGCPFLFTHFWNWGTYKTLQHAISLQVYTDFSRNQNARYVGTRCIPKDLL